MFGVAMGLGAKVLGAAPIGPPIKGLAGGGRGPTGLGKPSRTLATLVGKVAAGAKSIDLDSGTGVELLASADPELLKPNM